VLIHDAISYMLTEDDLRATFATAAAHLQPGGVFITSPDWTSETFTGPYVDTGTNRREDVTFTLIEYTYDPDPTDTTIKDLMWYVIHEGGRTRVEQDVHITGLFPKQTWIDLMAEAGFDVELDPYDVHDDHREAHLFVGRLRA